MEGSEGEDQQPDLYQVALLIDQLKHDDPVLRVRASSFLVKISKALGPKRTREELLPFIKDSLDDEDEVLLTIAEKLGDLVSLVGGAQYIYLIMEPLEILAMVDESSVREAVVKSIEIIVRELSDEHILEHYYPLVARLSAKESFTSKISAAALFRLGYRRLPVREQEDFRRMFIKLCSDQIPVVRRAAALHLSCFAKVAELTEVQQQFLEPFRLLAEDDHDSVRIQTTQNCIELANLLPTELKLSRIRPIVASMANDKSWRVRWSLAKSVHSVCISLGPEIVNKFMVGICESLLTDNEAEVKSAAASNIPSFTRIMRKDLIIARIIPIMNQILSDSSELVRCSLASVLCDMACILGKDDTIQHLLPLLLHILRDDSSEVTRLPCIP